MNAWYLESISLIDYYNTTHLRVCGKLMPDDVQFKTGAFGVVSRKHVWSNSSFFLFYHVIDNSSRSAHASMFYPVQVLLTPYNRPIQVLEDFITCCYLFILRYHVYSRFYYTGKIIDIFIYLFILFTVIYIAHFP